MVRPRDADLFERCGADHAGLAGAAVDLVLELEEAADAVGVDIVGNGGAAELDGVRQHRCSAHAEPREFVAGEPAAALRRGRMPARKRALVGVDVADAVQHGLVQQGGLDGVLAPAEELREVFEGDGGGSWPGPV